VGPHDRGDPGRCAVIQIVIVAVVAVALVGVTAFGIWQARLAANDADTTERAARAH